MRLTAEEYDAMVWLGEPINLGRFVTEEMMRSLAAEGIVNYKPWSCVPRFTPAGIEAYRDAIGYPPTRHLSPHSSSPAMRSCLTPNLNRRFWTGRELVACPFHA